MKSENSVRVKHAGKALFFIFVFAQIAGAAPLYAQNGPFPAPTTVPAENGRAAGGIKSSLDWGKGIYSAEITVNLAAAGLKLPSGRVRAEEILEDTYLRLMRPGLLSIQADSSSTVYDLVGRGELSLEDIDRVIFDADRIAPSLSAGLSSIIGRYSIPLGRIASILSGRYGGIPRPLLPSPAADYTGIIIIADTALPIHGRNSSALLEPCLSPKILDTEMKVIFERSMTNIPPPGETKPLVFYTTPENIFRPTPSGIDDTLSGIVGQNPLRVMAREVFGIVPTDPVIDREDALLILSTENNRRLLAESRVVIVADSSVLLK